MPDDVSALSELIKNTFPSLLTRLADDVRDVKQELKDTNRKIDSLRSDELARVRELLVAEREARAAEVTRLDLAAARIMADMTTNRERIDGIEERLRWLSRLVIGAVLAGVISGIIALIFRAAH